ncbi:MAG: DUF1540 domain-containing protein [Bacilli bacterium]|nr:DUF1540 domain-containing protein [Bacilli bacterium]
MRKKNKNNINCDVENCKYNNPEEGSCELDEIQVSNSSEVDECSDKDDTACESFESEEGELTDEVYEVESENEDEEEKEED